MQINNYQSIQAIPTQQQTTPVSVNPAPKTTQEPGVQVSISAQAQQLSKTDNSTVPVNTAPVQLPVTPKGPLTGEKLEQAVQIKKAQTQYQIASDMANILSKDSHSNMSASTAYYLSENEDARELVLDTKSQQQTMANMQAYQEQTQSLNEQYS